MPQSEPYILLIDDDHDDLDMFSAGLQKKGIKVKTFDSSINALAYLTFMTATRNLQPSLIIMDYNMPKKNGHQALLAIKQNAGTKHIPVVMYSTSMPRILKEQLSDAGAIDCFIKPWTLQEFDRQFEIFGELTYSYLPNKQIA